MQYSLGMASAEGQRQKYCCSVIFPSLFSLVRIAVSFLLYLAIGSNFNLEYVFSSSHISRTFFSLCVLSITTVAHPLSAGRMMIV